MSGQIASSVNPSDLSEVTTLWRYTNVFIIIIIIIIILTLGRYIPEGV